MERDDRESAILSIRRAIDRGMTHIDTAEIYARGAVEELVGEAIAGYRGEVFLASKVHPDHATFAGTLLACEKSLRRLRTDRIDLYLLHWRGTQPLEETFRAFEALEKEGKIRAWGVSNFDVADLERAIEIAGEGVIACNQVLYNLQERDAEHLLQPVCERHGIALVAYSPLGSGHFPSTGSWRGDVLAGIAEAHDATPRAVALAFLARRPSAFVIPKAARLDHVEQLAKAADIVLSPNEIETIAAAFPLGPPKSKMPYV
ncbi:MAG: aldo/keto reductase [Labilithrix sp.]|nr:aldo/keto reductase [Labilithrix sp.]